MTRILLTAAAGAVLAAALVSAQAPSPDPIERALAAAPRNMREGAMVIKWKPDQTYETLREGKNRLVCYDQSGEPSEAAYAIQCTSVANLPRVAQNKKFELETDRAKRTAALDAAEKDGSRVKPEYGSVWYSLSGTDPQAARMHVTIAVPGATMLALGIPDTNAQGGAWIMNAGTTSAHIMTPGS